MDKIRSERIWLYKDGFRPILIRRWNYQDGSYVYEMRCHLYNNGDERWEKINLPNDEVERQITLYETQI